MKNISKLLLICAIFMTFIFSICYAEEEYTVIRKYSYYNASDYVNTKAFIKVYIGQKDITRYGEDGYIVITPTPNRTETDEYGNKFAYFDLSDYKPGRTIDITITRTYKPGSYNEEIQSRSESTVDLKNSVYVEPQEKIESTNSEIIAKAKEVTYGLSSDYKRAKALFEYVNTNLSYVSGNGSNQGALAALKSKKGVCEDFAALYAALCRALEIPCKVIAGYKIEKSVDKESEIKQDLETGEYYNTATTYKYELVPHTWNEIYFDDYGWVPVDTCVQYSKDGKRAVYWDSFGKIDGREYIACGLYNASRSELEYSSTLKEKSSSESVIVGTIETAEKHNFEDMAGFEWAQDSVNTLYNMNVIKGYTEKEYGPAGNVSRIEFICLLARILKNINYTPTTTGMIYYYLDYDRTHYSKQEYDFLMRCLEDAYPYDSKFAVGYGAMENIFGSRLEMNKPITRGEVVALMDAFLKLPNDYTATFTDMGESKFSSSIAKAFTNKLINGYSDGTFRPNNPISRAEIACVLDRYVGVKDFVF